MTLREVVLRVPGMDTVDVTRDVPYGMVPAPHRRMDVYRPPGSPAVPLPAVVLVTGYSDAGARRMLGCRLKDMASYVGWAKLFAAIGIVAIAYETEEPVGDTRALLDDLTARSASLGIDPSRLGIWSCSGNVPNALAALRTTAGIACAALCYGYMPEDEKSDDVARAAAQFGFANPTPESHSASLRDVPMLIVRAGGDETPGLNASLDRFVARALADDAAVTVLNEPAAPHAFDVLDDSDRSRAAIRQILGFFAVHLLHRPA